MQSPETTGHSKELRLWFYLWTGQAEHPREAGLIQMFSLGSLCANAGSSPGHNTPCLVLITSPSRFLSAGCLPPPPTPHLLSFFPIFPDTHPSLSSPLPSPHLQLAFLSLPDHSKSFLTSGLLFCSLLTPAGTHAVFLFTRMSIQILCLTKQRKTPL